MTIEEIKAFLSANKEKPEVVSLLSEFASKQELTEEIVGPWLETQEGQKILQPITDQRITQAIKVHDEKQAAKNKAIVDKRIAEEILKLHPEETPEQKRLKEIELKLADNERVMVEREVATQISAKAHEMGVDPIFVSGMKFQSVDEAIVWMKKVKDRDQEIIKKTTNEVIVANSPKPGSGNSTDGEPDVSKMTTKERFEYFKKQAEERDAKTGTSGAQGAK